MANVELSTIQKEQRERFFDVITEQVGAPRTGVVSVSVMPLHVRVGYAHGGFAKGQTKVDYKWFNFSGWGSM